MDENKPAPPEGAPIREIDIERLFEQQAPAPDFTRSEHQAGLELRELNEIDQVLGLRASWSFWLLLWINILIVFQIALTVVVGWPGGYFNFQSHPYFLPLIVGQNVVQVVGMGVVIVKFLYPPGLQRLLSKK